MACAKSYADLIEKQIQREATAWTHKQTATLDPFTTPFPPWRFSVLGGSSDENTHYFTNLLVDRIKPLIYDSYATSEDWLMFIMAVHHGAPSVVTFMSDEDDGTEPSTVSLLHEAMDTDDGDRFEKVGGQLNCIRYLAYVDKKEATLSY